MPRMQLSFLFSFFSKGGSVAKQGRKWALAPRGAEEQGCPRLGSQPVLSSSWLGHVLCVLEQVLNLSELVSSTRCLT